MKIVLNKRYGGFELSHEAKMKIFEKRGIKVFPYIGNWDGIQIFYEKFTAERLAKGGILATVTYFRKDPALDEFDETVTEDSKYDPIYLVFDNDRSNKELIEVVEELGDKANTRFSELKVFEIPDGSKYEIDEHDGMETAYYGFELGNV